MTGNETRFNPERSLAIRNLLVDVVEQSVAGSARRAPKVLIVGAVVAGSLTLAAGAAVAATSAGWIAIPSHTAGGNATFATVPAWPVNAKGQTYGVQGDSPVAPDLIRAQGTNERGESVEGYVLSSEEAEPMPTSPAQALRQQADRLKKYPHGRRIPLYKSDGTTIIGEFTIGP